LKFRGAIVVELVTPCAIFYARRIQYNSGDLKIVSVTTVVTGMRDDHFLPVTN
jgi:hypothetical protein